MNEHNEEYKGTQTYLGT